MSTLLTAEAHSKTTSTSTGPQVVQDSDYATTESCIECHEERYLDFKDTPMGKILLREPEDPFGREGLRILSRAGRRSS